MHARDFVYWLQGYFELSTEDGKPFEGNIPEDVARKIQRHLAMVFIHDIDPKMGDAAHQAALTAAHTGGAAGQPPKDQTCPAGHSAQSAPSSPLPPAQHVAIPKC